MLSVMDHELRCANCGIVIGWQPTLVDGKPYCCPGCAEGGPCRCDYDNLPQPGEINPLVSLRARRLDAQ
jgi:hypothetical protein